MNDKVIILAVAINFAQIEDLTVSLVNPHLELFRTVLDKVGKGAICLRFDQC